MESGDNRSSHPILQNFMQLLPGLSQMLGPNWEVILHDLRYPDSSVIGIWGSVTGRTIGSPITNYVLQTIKSFGDSAPDRINYRTETLSGKILRSSTLFIRDEQWKIIGCLCFNCDVSPYVDMMERLQSLTNFSTAMAPMEVPLADTPKIDSVEEHFAMDVSDMMKDLVQKALSQRGLPHSGMRKAEKLQIVLDLEESGVFNIRGAVEHVASCLHVSIPTVYNYLKEIRGEGKSTASLAYAPSTRRLTHNFSLQDS